MYKFADLVSDILFEQGPAPAQSNTNTAAAQTSQPSPQQAQPTNQQTERPATADLIQFLNKTPNSKFPDLVKAYNSKFQTNIDPLTIENFLQSVCAPGYFAGKTLESSGGYTFLPFFDAFLQILTAIRQQPPKNPQADYTVLKDTLMKQPDMAAPFFESAIQSINKTIDSNVESYNPANGALFKAKGVLDTQVDKLSQVAMTELHSSAILPAIEKIVAKRTNVINRISHIKGLKKPFSKTLIQPLFYSYTYYVSSTPSNLLGGLYGGWQKKIQGDFKSAVDDLTSNKIMEIAILAAEFYKHLLNKVLAGHQDKNEQPQPVNASLNVFDKFVTNILNELSKADIEAGKHRTYQDPLPQLPQQQKEVGLTIGPKEIKEIKDMLIMTGDQRFVDYQNFLEKGVGRYFPGVVYNLGEIDKLARSGVPQAKALYDAIKGIAFYTRRRPGANDVMKAVGALHSGIGPVN